MKYSFIIPVFNRPNEVDELLQSLTTQTLKDFDVLVVEDGSTLPCQDVVARYANQLAIHYYNKPNSGPGQTRNYGVQRATGEYVLILDSDVVLPPGYLAAVDAELTANPCDAFGGPDRAHKDFSPTQKAINYAMTSFFTTGGIRGGKKKMDKFYPRSFNMGVRREVYNALNGFSEMRFGEDIDFSTRIFEGGHSCRLFPEAWVWHKRRTDLKSFQASAQLGHRTHQSVKTPPQHTQTGTHPAGHIHSRLRPAYCAGCHRSHLWLSTLVGHAAALCTVCHHHLRRCHTCRTQFWRRDSCHGSFLYPTLGLWLRLLARMVAPLRVGQRRV